MTTCGVLYTWQQQAFRVCMLLKQWMAGTLFWDGCLATTASTRSQVSSLRLLHTPGSAVKVCQWGILQPSKSLAEMQTAFRTRSTWTELNNSDSCSNTTTGLLVNDGEHENWWNRSCSVRTNTERNMSEHRFLWQWLTVWKGSLLNCDHLKSLYYQCFHTGCFNAELKRLVD